MKIFTRIANSLKITITVEKTKETPADYLNSKETKKTNLAGIEFILYKFFGLESSSSQVKQDLEIERRTLFCKKFISEKEGCSFSEEEGDRLMHLSSILTNYHSGIYDSLYKDFIVVLEETGGIEAYQNKPILTPKEREERLKDAKLLFEKIKLKRLSQQTS